MEILIAGGGIGGLTAAIALQQHGFEAHVFEAAPELRAVGTGIWMPPNAMTVLERLGIAGEIMAAGLPLSGIEVLDIRAGLLQAIDPAGLARAVRFPTVAIRRSELQRILASALRPGSLHLGREVVRLETAAGGVRVHFADGSGADGRMLIGADGLRSTVRRQIRPDVRLRYSGQTCFRGLAPVELPDGLRAVTREIWGGAERFGFSAVGDGAVYWFAPITAPPGTAADPAKSKQELLARYAHFPAFVYDIIEATRTETILQTDLFDIRPFRGWCDGNVVLLGDAAHASTPNLGQGGAQAVEDAFCLARILRESGLDVRAFAEYERIRSPRTRGIINLSRTFGRMAHWRNPIVRTVRNAALRATPDSVARRRMVDLYTPHV